MHALPPASCHGPANRPSRSARSRAVPATILVVAFVALGCMTPPPTQYDLSGAPGNLDIRYANKFEAAAIPTDPREIRVAPLGLRPQEDGIYVDALLLGKSATRVATILNEHLRAGTMLNASIAVRRISPDPEPLRLRWDGDNRLLINHEAIGLSNYIRRETPTLPDGLAIIAIPLRSDPFLSDGRYELRLLVPQDPAARIADLRDLHVVIDESPVVNDIRRIAR